MEIPYCISTNGPIKVLFQQGPGFGGGLHTNVRLLLLRLAHSAVDVICDLIFELSNECV